MCGLTGQFRLDGRPADAEAVRAAAERLAHRGPDDAGFWSGGPAALGFRRLSILDLENGAQPMSSEDGRFTLVFNGEIYNHPALKAELEGQGARYRTRSDAETILHLVAREGEAAFGRLEGMFAVAVFDARKGELLLARDGMGVKPLYYAVDASTLSFASELRALSRMLPSLDLDPAGIGDYLAYGFVHGPRTALARALKLPPGHVLKANARGVSLERFWDLPARPADGPGPTMAEAESEVERLLIASVRGQLLSDVPVGAFLSGGVDSSLIAALMAKAAPGKVQTFSIGFSGARAGLDESAHARAVARYLGTEHHELVLPATVLDKVEDLAPCLDEPIADSAILPTFLLSRFARERVKVALSGEGADELFAGYGRYKAALLSERVLRLPSWARPVVAALARRAGSGRVFDAIPAARARDWAEAAAHGGGEVRAVLAPELRERSERADALDWLKSPEEPQTLNGALAFDLRTVLCDCLLMKVDKASMRAGLEARVPYLDRRLVSYALGLPASLKIRRLKGKYLLRRVAQRHLPRAIAWRRKHGFVVPWEEWVRSPGETALDRMLADGDLARRGVFDLERLRAMRRTLRAGGSGADAGLLFRAAVLGLWLRSL
ncbi:MAG TPA: asparagine synthase (glutamine-hydrolyzing) [Elusimicrobiota bacterium]|jgi:asparagine synthase (glutamine-hydrolysing)|nr:asparagine synthase (glutamine-hydrolyzing) [Elusimicrobiota bacterium]